MRFMYLCMFCPYSPEPAAVDVTAPRVPPFEQVCDESSTEVFKASAHIGFFAVLKKDGRHRLILDCRPVNRLFLPPPGVDLLKRAKGKSEGKKADGSGEGADVK